MRFNIRPLGMLLLIGSASPMVWAAPPPEKDLPALIRRTLDEAAREVRPFDPQARAGQWQGSAPRWTADHPSGATRYYFSRDSVHIRTLTASGGAADPEQADASPDDLSYEPQGEFGVWSMRLVAVDDGAALMSIDQATPTADGDRVSYDHGEIVEWYVNRRDGLKQGFTLGSSPSHPPADLFDEESASPLVGSGWVELVLEVDGVSSGELSSDGAQAVFQDTDGQRVEISGLAAFDAMGTPLDTEMLLVDDLLIYRVRDEGATYPIDIDPLITVAVGGFQWTFFDAPNFFGASVAMDGDTLVVGSGGFVGSSKVFVFRDAESGWALEQQIDDPAWTPGTGFGTAVALKGNRMLASAPTYFVTTCAPPVDYQNAGLAWAFNRGGGGWSNAGPIYIGGCGPGGHNSTDDQLGWSLAITDAHMFLSAPGYDAPATNNGAVFRIEHTGGLGTGITGVQRFGEAMDADDRFIIAGNDAGSVRVFDTQNQGLLQTFSLGGVVTAIALDTNVFAASASGQTEVFAYDGAQWVYDQAIPVGGKLAVAGDRLLIGRAVYRNASGSWALEQNLGDMTPSSVSMTTDAVALGFANSDEVVIYRRNSTVWTVQGRLGGGGPLAGAKLGLTMASSGSRVIVGAPHDNYSLAAAYIFGAHDGDWLLEKKLKAPDGGFGWTSFGASVDITGAYAAVGAPLAFSVGRVALYELRDGDWAFATSVKAPVVETSAQFGASVSLAGALQKNWLLVGAPFTDSFDLSDAGAAYLFERDDSTGDWSFIREHTCTDPSANEQFGAAVGLVANFQLPFPNPPQYTADAYVGTPNDDASGSDRGTVHCFHMDTAGAWSFEPKLTAGPEAVNGDHFGAALCVKGKIVVGAPDHDIAGGGSDQGAIYIFDGDTTSYLTAGDAVTSDHFGAAVASMGNVVLAGAPFDDIGIGTNAGSAYLFSKSDGAWAQRAKLTAASAGGDTLRDDNFGTSLAVVKDDSDAYWAIAGEPLENGAAGTDEGALFFFPLNVCAATNRDITLTSASTMCSGATVSVNILASESGASYQLRNGTTSIGGAVSGNGGTITLSGPLSVTTAGVVTLNVQVRWNETDCVGQLAETANVTVNRAPTITTHPTNRSVNFGGSTTFTVAASGSASFTYRWQKDGADIPGATSSSYTVNPVTFESEGAYRCIVTNACGSATSNAGVLTVTAATPIIYVRPGGAGVGNTWANALGNLSDALLTAEQAEGAIDEIWVATGTYKPAVSNRGASFMLVDGVSVYGGFVGGETNRAQRNPTMNVTTLSGDLLGNDAPNFTNYAENSYHVVEAPANVGDTTILDGFTIRGGAADGASPDNRGGGLNIEGAPRIMDCRLMENTCVGGGGGAYVTGSAFFERCLVRGNRATGTNFNGGGLRFGGGDSRVLGSLIIENTTTTSGGGVAVLNADAVELVNCVIAGNVASTNNGGGVSTSGSSLSVVNCTVVGNISNAGVGAGAGVRISSGSANIVNSIFYGNFGANQISNSGSSSVTYCDVQGGLTGAGNIDANPAFVDADGADNNPATFSDNDYRLAACSPAIDAGDGSAVPGDVDADLAGGPRFFDDGGVPNVGVGAPPVDMGAYERQFASAECEDIPGDLDGDGDVDIGDVAITLASFGACIGDAGYNPDADLNGDGCIDLGDLSILLGNYGG